MAKKKHIYYCFVYLSLILCIGCHLIIVSCNSPKKRNEIVEIAEFPDQELQRLKKFTNTKDKINYLLNLCSQLSEQNPKLTLQIAQLARSWAVDARMDLEEAIALYWIAFTRNQLFTQSLELYEALVDIKVAVDNLESLSEILWLGRALNLQSLIHFNLYEDEDAIRCNKEAFNKLRLVSKKSHEYYRLRGDIYRTFGNFKFYDDIKLTEENYDSSYQSYQMISDTSRIILLLTNRALLHRHHKNWELADSIFSQAAVIVKELNQNEEIVKFQLEYATFLADLHIETKNSSFFHKSNALLNDALGLKPSKKAELFYQVGANFQHQAVFDPDSSKIYYDSTVIYYDKVISIGVLEQNITYIELVAQEVGKVCSEIGNEQCSSLLQKTAKGYQAILDSTRHALVNYSTRIENFKDQQVKTTRNRILSWSVIVFVCTIFVFGFFIQSARIKKSKAQLKATESAREVIDAKLQALRAQMNPHFISNTLNAIDSLIQQNRAEEASDYLIDFSRLCRRIIDHSFESLIPLEKELQTLGYYLSLEKLRMKDKLTYQLNIADNVDQAQIKVPPMFLQPFVENAIEHGIHNLAGPGVLILRIQMLLSEQKIEYLIQDNGVGREKAIELKRKSKKEVHTSHGIKITRSRIEALGGHVEVVDLKDDTRNPNGTLIAIQFPFITPKAED